MPILLIVIQIVEPGGLGGSVQLRKQVFRVPTLLGVFQCLRIRLRMSIDYLATRRDFISTAAFSPLT
jgi:hypothetical protein